MHDAPTPEAGPRLTARVGEAAPLPMVEVVGRDHVVGAVNAAFCRLVGQARADLLGKSFADLVGTGADRQHLLDRVYQADAATRTTAAETDPSFWLSASWPTLAANEPPVGIVIQVTKTALALQNITEMNEALLIAGLRQHELHEESERSNLRSRSEIAERVRAEVVLRDANDLLTRATRAAEQASKAKDDFLAALSHELRTPLTPVLLAAATLREDPRLPPDARELLGMMERNIALEARLIDDLLDLTKIAHGKLHLRLEACDAHSLIGLAIEIVREDARAKGIVIERIFTARRSGLLADPARFQQVIWNLLRNAVKFTPVAGRISVHTVEEKTASVGVWLRIEVTDSGIGISPARIEQIFQPFDQGDLAGHHRFGGVGLGLAIARAVVVSHGGRLTARSAGVNRGSTFVVELPGAFEPHPGIVDPVTPAPDKAARVAVTLRVLLVEDHQTTLDALSLLLRRDGHQVVPATTMAAALAAAAGQDFDLVISDLGLPDGGGIELMLDLRANHGLRGIALSGYGMEDDLLRTRAAGFDRHLVKPVSMTELRRTIASLFAAEGPDRPAPSGPGLSDR
jgi:signal transduction histidine kinase/ActR/RegA family two-component response regulator